MQKLNEWIDRFCAKHPNLGITGLMRYIVIGSIAAYILIFFTAYRAFPLLTLSVKEVLQGQVWRLVTFLFVPTSLSPLSFLLSLYFYYWMGNILENYWGTTRFTIYYFSGAFLTILASFLIYFSVGGGGSYGIHYVNMAMFLAYAALNPEGIVYLFFILPLKIKWIAWVDLAYFGFEVLTGIANRSWGEAVAPIIALLNFFVFFYPQFSSRFQRKTKQHHWENIRYRKP